MIQYMFNMCICMFDNLVVQFFFFFTEKSVKISSCNYGSSISPFGSITLCFIYFEAVFLVAYKFRGTPVEFTILQLENVPLF